MRTRNRISIAALAATMILGSAQIGQANDVDKRMAGMSAMQKQVKALAPIMRGMSEYDADAVRSAADTVITNSGDVMTELFAEGSNAPPSEALDTIWEDWDGFAELANALAVTAEGMKRAAGNGLGGNEPGQGSGMMSDSASNTVLDAETLAEMPVDAAFAAMTRICSSCHSKFRAKKF